MDRSNLQTRLEEILGSQYVYFQPNAKVQLHYPCFVYRLEPPSTLDANNAKYKIFKRYSLTFIHHDPDNPITYELVKEPMCKMDRSYIADNLYHEVYTIFN